MIPDRDPRQQNFPWALLPVAAFLVICLLGWALLILLGIKEMPPPRYGQSVFL